MFGIVTASLPQLSDEEKSRYHELYCGLCLALRDRYGQISRTTLNYDLTFYVIVANALHEPDEALGSVRCITQPQKKMSFARSAYTDYAADVTVALAYHKCLDDWHDEHSRKARIAQALLAGAYTQAKKNIPTQCEAIEHAMGDITRLEEDPNTPPDDIAFAFGWLFGELFAHDEDTWRDMMRLFGAQLGRFIYLMDAAVDYAEDERTTSYNPLVNLHMPPENMKTLLAVLIGDAAATFEKLPLEQDLHLMRCVLYSGVWQKFNETYPDFADDPTAYDDDKKHDRRRGEQEQQQRRVGQTS